MEYQITSEKQYHETMILIYDLMNKGEANLVDADIEKLRTQAFIISITSSPHRLNPQNPEHQTQTQVPYD
jgi:hypothetical protein